VNKAVDVLVQIGTDPFSPEFYRQVHEVASDLIRVSEMLQDGKLAPTAKERAAKGAAKGAAK
jgi:hypothetical protein